MQHILGASQHTAWNLSAMNTAFINSYCNSTESKHNTTWEPLEDWHAIIVTLMCEASAITEHGQFLSGMILFDMHEAQYDWKIDYITRYQSCSAQFSVV